MRPLLKAPLHSGRALSGMGSTQPVLAKGSAYAGQVEPRCRHVIPEQCPLRRVDAPSADGSDNLGDLWQGRGRPLRLRKQLSLPNLLFEDQRCVGPRLAQPTLVVRANSAACSSPLPIPLRRDLLSQANGTIWHPRPELFGRSTEAYESPRAHVKHYF